MVRELNSLASSLRRRIVIYEIVAANGAARGHASIRQARANRKDDTTERLLTWVLCGCLMMLPAAAVCAQTYPVNPIRIVTAEPGGGHDFAARMIAQGIAPALGQQVIVENRSGASSHLAVELFKFMAGVDLVRIPYRDNGPALIAVDSGQVQLIFPTAGSVAPHLKSDRLRALAVASPQPTSLFPALPTVAAAGLPGYESDSIVGVFAPAKTPAAIINRLNTEIQQALNMPESKKRFFDSGVETIGGAPAQLAAAVKSEMTILGKLIKDSGIRAE